MHTQEPCLSNNSTNAVLVSYDFLSFCRFELSTSQFSLFALEGCPCSWSCLTTAPTSRSYPRMHSVSLQLLMLPRHCHPLATMLSSTKLVRNETIAPNRERRPFNLLVMFLVLVCQSDSMRSVQPAFSPFFPQLNLQQSQMPR